MRAATVRHHIQRLHIQRPMPAATAPHWRPAAPVAALQQRLREWRVCLAAMTRVQRAHQPAACRLHLLSPASAAGRLVTRAAGVVIAAATGRPSQWEVGQTRFCAGPSMRPRRSGERELFHTNQ